MRDRARRPHADRRLLYVDPQKRHETACSAVTREGLRNEMDRRGRRGCGACVRRGRLRWLEQLDGSGSRGDTVVTESTSETVTADVSTEGTSTETTSTEATSTEASGLAGLERRMQGSRGSRPEVLRGRRERVEREEDRLGSHRRRLQGVRRPGAGRAQGRLRGPGRGDGIYAAALRDIGLKPGSRHRPPTQIAKLGAGRRSTPRTLQKATTAIACLGAGAAARSDDLDTGRTCGSSAVPTEPVALSSAAGPTLLP